MIQLTVFPNLRQSLSLRIYLCKITPPAKKGNTFLVFISKSYQLFTVIYLIIRYIRFIFTRKIPKKRNFARISKEKTGDNF